MQNDGRQLDSRLTTPSLLMGVRAGDDSSWARVFEIYGPLVSQWIRKFGFADDEADDLRQTVFQSASENIENYQHNPRRTGSLRAWLWGITRNKVCDEIERRNRSPNSFGGTTALLQINQIPDRPFEESDSGTRNEAQRQLAVRALQLIKTDFQEKTWRAFWRTVVDAVPTRDVAAELDMSTASIRQARFRVLRHLRNELGEDLPSELA